MWRRRSCHTFAFCEPQATTSRSCPINFVACVEPILNITDLVHDLYEPFGESCPYVPYVHLVADGREFRVRPWSDSFDELQSIVRASDGRELVFGVDRGGVVTQLKAIPTRQEISDRFGNRLSVGVMGIRRNPVEQEREDRRYRPIEYVRVAVNDSYHFVWRTLDLAVGKGEGGEL